MHYGARYQNSGLLSAKTELLNSLVQNFENHLGGKFNRFYLFHGFILNFVGSHEGFLDHITSFLPQSWRVSPSQEMSNYSQINIHLVNEWGVDWDLEENADCLISRTRTEETAIQRDFVGVDKGQTVLISLDKNQSDGIFNALRWILPRRLLKKGYFLLHSSCVVTDGKAQFFLGHSGAGKSTVASLVKDRIVLGDDMNIMRLVEGRVLAKAGGLGGMSFKSTNFDREYPVSSFFWLVQSQVDHKEPMSSSASVAKFLASLANIFWEHLEPNEKEDLVNLAIEVVKACPFYKLNFTKSQECWKNVI